MNAKEWILILFLLFVTSLFVLYPLYLSISSIMPSFFSNEEKIKCLKSKFNIQISNYKNEEKKKFWIKIFNKVLNIHMDKVKVDKYGNGDFKAFSFDNIDICFDILRNSKYIDVIYVNDNDNRAQAKVEVTKEDRYISKIIVDIFYIRRAEYLTNLEIQEKKEKLKEDEEFIKIANEMIKDE